MVSATDFRRKSCGYLILAASLVLCSFFVCFGLKHSGKSVLKIYDEFRRRAVQAFQRENYQMTSQNLEKALIVKGEGDPVVNSLLTLLDKRTGFPCLFLEPVFVTFVKYATVDRDPAIREIAEEMLSKSEAFGEGLYDFGQNSVRNFLKGGWSNNEGPYPDLGLPTFVWAVGKSSEMDLFICDEKSSKILTFRVFPFPQEQRIDVMVNETLLESVKLERAWQEYDIFLDSSCLNRGSNKITFLFKEVVSPSESGSPDTRQLAVAFDWIRVENASGVVSRHELSQTDSKREN